MCEVHLGDLVATQDIAAMEQARLEIETRLRAQAPEQAEELIAAWRKSSAAKE